MCFINVMKIVLFYYKTIRQNFSNISTSSTDHEIREDTVTVRSVMC